jgi:23S rRNA pseudouridine1911/1915/1917 synthase
MDILFEDNHLIAINKQIADIVQRDKTGDEALEDKVKTYIKEKYKKPGEVYLGVTHRIDRPVSGVVLFARTSKALERMNELFQKKMVEKTYWAIVKDKPPKTEDTLIHYIKRDQGKNKSYCSEKEVPGSKQAITHYKLIGASDNYFLLEISIETGRHHQIRSQLAKIGSPIRGDLKYGYSRSNPDGGISLHAKVIKFVHPIKKEMLIIEAPFPDDPLWKYFEGLAISE